MCECQLHKKAFLFSWLVNCNLDYFYHVYRHCQDDFVLSSPCINPCLSVQFNRVGLFVRIHIIINFWVPVIHMYMHIYTRIHIYAIYLWIHILYLFMLTCQFYIIYIIYYKIYNLSYKKLEWDTCSRIWIFILVIYNN